jgi:hypothetical protein
VSDPTPSLEIVSITAWLVKRSREEQKDLLDELVPAPSGAVPNHRLWFHDEAWHCHRDGEALAKLGGLAGMLPPLPPEPPFKPGPFVRRRKGM